MAGVRVVVADGSSSDGTEARLRALCDRFPNLAVIDNPPRLQAAAINRIVATCATPAHEILVRCDAHAVYPPRYVLDVAESLFARDAAALATCMDAGGPGGFQRRPPGSPTAPSARAAPRTAAAGRPATSTTVTMPASASTGSAGSAATTPGFSRDEDAELDHGLARAGGRIWLDARHRPGLRDAPDARGARPAVLEVSAPDGAGRSASIGCGPASAGSLPPVLVAALLLGLPLTPAARLPSFPRPPTPPPSSRSASPRRCGCGASAASGPGPRWRPCTSPGARLSRRRGRPRPRRPAPSRRRRPQRVNLRKSGLRLSFSALTPSRDSSVS